MTLGRMNFDLREPCWALASDVGSHHCMMPGRAEDLPGHATQLALVLGDGHDTPGARPPVANGPICAAALRAVHWASATVAIAERATVGGTWACGR